MLMKKQSSGVKALLVEIVGLSSPRGRLLFFVVISAVIFLAPPKWPISFSLWQHLGVPSPSIGLTRAYRLVLHGDFAAAWQQNKLIYAVIIIGGWLLAKDIFALIRTSKK